MTPTYIGIDLGGSKIEVVRATLAGIVEDRVRVPLMQHTTGEELCEQLTSLVESVRTPQVIGVGLAHPGIIDHTRTLHNTPNIPYLEGRQEFGKVLESYFGLPVRTDNDANCFVLAEAMFGVAKDASVTLGITWGTGIGGGAVVQGRLLRGAFGGAMEIGRTVLSVGDMTRDIEYYCTGTYPLERYDTLGGTYQERDRVYIFQSYREDPIAARVRLELLEIMARALANWTYVLQPELIVIGGGVSNSDIYEDLEDLYRQFVLPALGAHVRIVSHSLGDAAGALGAIALFV